jgi:hypothetical protein
MRKIFSLITWLTYLLGLLIFLSLRGKEHDWMSEMDPTVGKIDGSDNRLIFTSAALILVLVFQIFSFTRAQRLSQRILISIASFFAIAIWYFYCFNV